jgi:hypothetical protein
MLARPTACSLSVRERFRLTGDPPLRCFFSSLIFRQPCWRRSSGYQCLPPPPHRSICGAFDAPRRGDADRAADRPQTECSLQRGGRCGRASLDLSCGRRVWQLQPADARTRLAAANGFAAWCSGALRMHREPEIYISNARSCAAIAVRIGHLAQ